MLTILSDVFDVSDCSVAFTDDSVVSDATVVLAALVISAASLPAISVSAKNSTGFSSDNPRMAVIVLAISSSLTVMPARSNSSSNMSLISSSARSFASLRMTSSLMVFSSITSFSFKISFLSLFMTITSLPVYFSASPLRGTTCFLRYPQLYRGILPYRPRSFRGNIHTAEPPGSFPEDS